jgi:Putative MetA-pathway of phenol degradation
MRKTLLCGALSTLAFASPVLAQETEEAPICTDRPTKANATCTVPVGKFQLEATAVSWTRVEAGGAKTNIWSLGSSVVKFGLSDRSDLQSGLTPFVHAGTKVAGEKSSVSGFGDITVRYKHRLTGDGSKVQVAVIPFAKLPTADRDIGNGKVDGGLAVPVSMAVGRATLTFGPEADLIADLDGNGRHVAVVNLVNLAGPVAPGLTLVGELWTATNFDPADTVTLASADAALAYAVNPNLQLDLGANLGLNSATSDLEVYAGVSFRF